MTVDSVPSYQPSASCRRPMGLLLSCLPFVCLERLN